MPSHMLIMTNQLSSY